MQPKLACPDMADLELFADSQLAQGAGGELEHHLSSCCDCRARLDEVRENLRMAGSLRRVRAAAGSSSVDISVQAVAPAAPPTIEGFDIVREIGRGGMGIVYEARQHAPRRLVAIKVLNLARVESGRGERLMRREADALARLRHPAIAAIYETGLTSDGRLFVAMELVEGVKLTEAAAALGPATMRDKLRLFVQVCEGISYAHQRGVIHRDIKPANILVSEGFEGPGGQGAKGEPRDAGAIHSDPRSLGSSTPIPKILDFGLAKIIDDDSELHATLLSEPGRVQGTLPYMSPEQARGDAHEIDVRSDVYSLGVVLYELLTGALPYELDRTRFIDAVRTINEAAPVRPATRLRALRGDLETILLKALEKEPSRRYASAAALADDIERWLRHEPIVARPASATYHLSKLIQRNKLGAALTASLLAVVVGFSAWMSLLYAEADEQRGKAEKSAQQASVKADEAATVRDVLHDMLVSADPDRVAGREVTVREIADETAQRLDEGEFAEHPQVEAALRQTMAAVTLNLGQYAAAESHARRAVELRSSGDDDAPADLAEAHHYLAQALKQQGRLEDACREAEQSLALRRKLDDPAPLADELLTMADLSTRRARNGEAEAYCREGLELARARLPQGASVEGKLAVQLALLLRDASKLDEAAALLGEALETTRAADGVKSSHYARALEALGLVHTSQGKAVDAQREYQQAYEIRAEIFGEKHPITLATLSGLGENAKARGDEKAAEELHRRALAGRREALGDRNPATAISANNLGALLADAGKLDEAEALLREAYDVRRELLGTDHTDTLSTLNNLCVVLNARKDYAASEPLLREILAARRRTQAGDHLLTGRALNNLGSTLRSAGKLDEAEELHREALAMRRRLLGDDHAEVAVSLGNLAVLLKQRGSLDDAESCYREALRINEKSRGEKHPDTLRVRQNLAALLQARGQLEEADALFAETLAALAEKLGEKHVQVAVCSGLYAKLKLERGQTEAALELARRELAIREALGGADSADAQRVRQWIEKLEAGDARATQP